MPGDGGGQEGMGEKADILLQFHCIRRFLHFPNVGSEILSQNRINTVTDNTPPKYLPTHQ